MGAAGMLIDWLRLFCDVGRNSNSMDERIERARALNRQASDDIDHGKLDAAKITLNETIRLVPEQEAPHTNLGGLHCWEGELDEAVTLHLKARQLDPNLSAPHTNLSVVTVNLKNVDLANLQTLPVGAPSVFLLFGVK